MKPERERNNDAFRKDNWWIFGRPRPELREALVGLARYIVTLETSSRRYFVFVGAETLPDGSLVAIASDDAYHLGILSSTAHTAWVSTIGSRRGEGLRYTKTVVYDTFPFPDATPAQAERIRQLGERLDAHRKERQAAHPRLTLTDLYAALDKHRAGASMTAKQTEAAALGDLEKLAALHAELDAAVAEAYGWPDNLSDADILQRLLDLNRARAVEEKAGRIRSVRPAAQEAVPTEKRPDPITAGEENVACRSFVMVAA